MLRFLATRRWVVRIVAGLALAVACVALGLWQLDRNEQRQARNAVIEANIDQAVLPIDELLGSDRPAASSQQWTPVHATGNYDEENRLVIRLRPLDGQPGVHVLTPLVTHTGAAVLVDQGFMASPGTTIPELPPLPDGVVEVVGRIRLSQEGRGTGGDPTSGAIRYVDLGELEASLPYPVYGGWLELIDQDPALTAELEPPRPPLIEPGPHLSYAIQWFAFATIGVGGFIVLVRAEAKARREDENGTAGGTRSVVERASTRTR